MERPSKRRRLHQREGLRGAHCNLADFLEEPEANIALSHRDKSHGMGAPLRRRMQHGALDEDPKQREPSVDQNQKMRPRQIVPAPVSQAAQPASTAVESVVRVIIDNPAGNAVGDTLVPAQSSIFNFDNYGPVTLTFNAASSTPLSQPPARFESASPSTTTGLQSQAPQLTRQTTSTPTDQSSSRPSEVSPASSSPSTNSPASQIPMTISVPGSSSQVMLSSPPATPVSSPSSSTSSTSTTGITSTSSYFSLSSSASSASSSTNTSATPSPNTTPTNPSVPVPTTGNFSATTIASSQTSTGSKGPTSITIGVPSSNSTLITSTRTSSSSSSGLGTTSGTSSQTTSTINSSLSTTSSSSTNSLSSTLSSSPTSTTSGAGVVPGGIGGATGTSAGSSPSSTSGAGAGSGSSSAPSTPTVVGGVVGGVAGLTILLLLILVFFRWRRRKTARGRGISQPMAQTIPPPSIPPSGTVTERSSNVPFAAAGFFKRIRPRSSATAATTETAPSERGFQNFGGRKIQSVLEHGGDGFGNPEPSSSAGPSRPAPGFGDSPAAGFGAGLRPASPQTPLSETSFYRDSQGFYGGAPEPEPSSNPSSMYGRPESLPPRSPDRPGAGLAITSPLARVGSQARRDEEVAFMRPGPARTPVTNQPGFSTLRPPATGRGTPPPRPLPGVGGSPTPRDGVGRSHPSFDGSRGSRFTEEIAPP